MLYGKSCHPDENGQDKEGEKDNLELLIFNKLTSGHVKEKRRLLT